MFRLPPGPLTSILDPNLKGVLEMPKSVTDGVTLNTKGTTVKVAMDSLTVEEQDDLGALLRLLGRADRSIRSQMLRSCLELLRKGGK